MNWTTVQLHCKIYYSIFQAKLIIKSIFFCKDDKIMKPLDKNLVYCFQTGLNFQSNALRFKELHKNTFRIFL